MNGVHDMGGLQGLGAIAREENEPVFHEEWEGRTMALNRALRAGSHYSLDEFRYAMERIEPSLYLRCSYFERWLEALITMTVEKGLITQEELDSRLDDLTAGNG
jgi:nitrile hydratase